MTYLFFRIKFLRAVYLIYTFIAYDQAAVESMKPVGVRGGHGPMLRVEELTYTPHTRHGCRHAYHS
jgi:hypothetical protein